MKGVRKFSGSMGIVYTKRIQQRILDGRGECGPFEYPEEAANLFRFRDEVDGLQLFRGRSMEHLQPVQPVMVMVVFYDEE